MSDDAMSTECDRMPVWKLTILYVFLGTVTALLSAAYWTIEGLTRISRLVRG